MSTQQTLSIIKPDAVAKNAIGGVLHMIESAGLRVVATKMVAMSKFQAEGFYAVHSERPFFGELTDFMSSGCVVVSVLEGDNAIQRYRDLMGPTNSNEAPEGTIRAKYGTDIQANAVHGSDSPESAATEIPFFFSAHELRGLNHG
ncbi:MAG: nucleoside-diphosphate kinase [Deltaproteobacteria bacterium]|nr:MAG: nucleoside-diphosphate kinase [Deltaproteobacteria bacterium]